MSYKQPNPNYLVSTLANVQPLARRHAPRLKSVLGILISILVGGCLLPLILVEAAVYLRPSLLPAEIRSSIFQTDRAILPAEQSAQLILQDQLLGYKYAPNVIDHRLRVEQDKTFTLSTVSLGYEGIGFRDDGVNGEPFAIVLGDSYANCSGVALEVCWVERLEQKMGRDVANLSVLGYSPQQEQRILTHYGLPLKPKLVLWVFFANDLKDAWRFQQFGSGAMKETPFWQNPVKAWLAQHSAVYITFSFFWYNRNFFYRLSQAEKGADPGIAWWLANIDPAVPEVAQGLELTEATILEASRQAQAEGIQFVVVVLPFREQVYGPPDLQRQFDSPIGRLTELLQQQGALVIDLTGEMRARARQESQPLYFASDIHLNERGNEIAAELLAQKLQELLEQLQP
jgi:hypothetical protein